MTANRKIHLVKKYHLSLILITLFWLLFLPEPIDVYGIILYLFLGFAVFMYFAVKELYAFSGLVQKNMPDYFRQNLIDYSPFKGKLLNGSSVWFHKKEFQEFGDMNVQNHRQLVKLLFKQTLIAFVLSMPLSFLIIYLKR